MNFSVVAIIAAYNEADVIGPVVGDLIAQGVQVYFLDDGSTDGTVAAVERYVGRGVVGIETRRSLGEGGFDWERILLRKTELARELDATWFIHHDADEFRESPWAHLSLSQAIQHVDALGFNAIDFTGLDFSPIDDRFLPGDDVRESLTFYSEQAPYDRPQIRCWKKASDLDLASSGGHEARFHGRRIFPLRFLLRHYPIRGQAHGERKVFQERRRRFSEGERARGWHVQYDQVGEGASFIRDRSTLTGYDPDAVRMALTLRHGDVEALEASLEECRADLDRTRAELAQARAELDRANAGLAQTRTELQGWTAEAARLRDGLEQRTAEVAHTLAALGARTAEAGGLREAFDDTTRRLEEVHRSFSWRWTWPARALYRLFRGRSE